MTSHDKIKKKKETKEKQFSAILQYRITNASFISTG